jgi:hypothetical protein
MKDAIGSLLLLTLPAALALAADDAPRREENPAASRLLAEARAARATWDDFPGFTAAVEVNLDGAVRRGRLHVDAKGAVRLDGLDKPHQAWARRQLASIISHRTDASAARQTPCAFADDDTSHPLGRAIVVLNDELHSSYRIRDRQITVVNRTTPDRRFTITVLENRPNPEGKFLPVSFVVNYWDLKSGALVRSDANHQTWQRVGKFDLPVTARVVTAAREGAAAEEGAGAPPSAATSKGGYSVKDLKLSEIKLADAAAAR